MPLLSSHRIVNKHKLKHDVNTGRCLTSAVVDNSCSGAMLMLQQTHSMPVVSIAAHTYPRNDRYDPALAPPSSLSSMALKLKLSLRASNFITKFFGFTFTGRSGIDERDDVTDAVPHTSALWFDGRSPPFCDNMAGSLLERLWLTGSSDVSTASDELW